MCEQMKINMPFVSRGMGIGNYGREIGDGPYYIPHVGPVPSRFGNLLWFGPRFLMASRFSKV